MAETNHNNKKNVSLGKPKKTGCLYYAPAGTALPTDATTALPAAYTCVGYLSEDGVTNAYGRAHDVPNLFISDGSVFTTGAAANPTLTIVALAIRQAEHIVQSLKAQEL